MLHLGSEMSQSLCLAEHSITEPQQRCRLPQELHQDTRCGRNGAMIPSLAKDRRGPHQFAVSKSRVQCKCLGHC
jgi:hypothetical protein